MRMEQEPDILIEEAVYIAPGDFWSIPIHAHDGDTIEIVVQENDGYDFDILLLHGEDVDDEGFYDKYARLEVEKQTYYRGSYQFKEAGDYSIVISCVRAREISRELYVKVTKIKEKGTDYVTDASVSHLEMQLTHKVRLSIRGLVILTVLLSVYMFLALSVGIFYPWYGVVILSVGGIVFAIFHREVRALIIELEDDE